MDIINGLTIRLLSIVKIKREKEIERERERKRTNEKDRDRERKRGKERERKREQQIINKIERHQKKRQKIISGTASPKVNRLISRDLKCKSKNYLFNDLLIHKVYLS